MLCCSCKIQSKSGSQAALPCVCTLSQSESPTLCIQGQAPSGAWTRWKKMSSGVSTIRGLTVRRDSQPVFLHAGGTQSPGKHTLAVVGKASAGGFQPTRSFYPKRPASLARAKIKHYHYGSRLSAPRTRLSLQPFRVRPAGTGAAGPPFYPRDPICAQSLSSQKAPYISPFPFTILKRKLSSINT